MSLSDYVVGMQLITEENRMHDSLGHVGELLKDKDPTTGKPLVYSPTDGTAESNIPQRRATADDIKLIANGSANYVLDRKLEVDEFTTLVPTVEEALNVFNYGATQYQGQVDNHEVLANYSLTNTSLSVSKSALADVGNYVSTSISDKLIKDVPDVADDVLGQYLITHDLLDAVSYIMKGMNWSTGDDLNWTFEKVKQRAILKCDGVKFFYNQFNRSLNAYPRNTVESQLLLVTVELADITSSIENIYQIGLNVQRDIEDCTSFGDLVTLSDGAIDQSVSRLLLIRRRWALEEK